MIFVLGGCGWIVYIRKSSQGFFVEVDYNGWHELKQNDAGIEAVITTGVWLGRCEDGGWLLQLTQV